MDGVTKETDMKTTPHKLLVPVLVIALAGLGACASPASPGGTSASTPPAGDFKSIWATGPWADNHHFIAPPN
jgi:hypothetical protein